jgi:hypothetical protein
MLALILALLVSAQTKIYVSGCAPVDTISALVPISEFRQIIINQETKKALEKEIEICAEIVDTTKALAEAYRQADIKDSIAADEWKTAFELADANRLAVVDKLDAVAAEARAGGFKKGFVVGSLVTAGTLALITVTIVSIAGMF